MTSFAARSPALSAELMGAFYAEAGEVLADLRRGVAALDTVAPGAFVPALAPLSLLAHRLRGSAGLYGFAQFSVLCGLLERVLDARPELPAQERTDYVALLDTVCRVLEGSLDTLRAGGDDRDLGQAFTRQGGTEQLRALLRAVPAAFTLRAPAHAVPQADPDADPAGEGTGDTASELRGFVREQAEVWDYFAPEVREHLAALRAELARGEAGDLGVMFRAAHTIKGSAYMVGLNVLGDFAHGAEDLLGAVRAGDLGLNAGVQGLLEQAADLADDLLLTAEGGEPSGGAALLPRRLAHLSEGLRRMASGEAPLAPLSATPAPTAPAAAAAPAEPAQAVAEAAQRTSIRVPAAQIEGLLDQVGGAVTSRARLSNLLGRLADLERSMSDSQQRFQRAVRDFEERHLNPDLVQRDDAPMNSERPLTGQFAELEFDTYDDLNILSRSVTELSADFSEVRRNLSDTVAELQDENERLGKLLRGLRLAVNRTSRVPFTQATARLKRWAREQQGEEGSLPFDLVTEGEDIQVESSVLQRLTGPLMHLLTNAVSHGLGSAEGRVQAGKAARGQVWLRAAETGQFLEVTVADDGQGLDLDRVRERALTGGLRSAQELGRMGDDELARLILLPGLSTAAEVGRVAGRGVGMDAVATAVRQLGGELLIQTERGVGTAFTLRLPTAQRIMDLLQVRVGGPESPEVAFALASVRALRDVPAEQIVQEGGERYARFEGELVPVVDLRPLWGQPAGEVRSYRLVFLTSVIGMVAAQVGEFGELVEAGVTAPGLALGSLDYLSGLALAPSGEVRPVLEPAGLRRLSRRPQAWLRQETVAEKAPLRRLLLVDDSLSVRKLVGRMLERGGYEVHVAADGQEALDLLHLDPHFDAVVTDLEMPRVNGYELMEGLRSRFSTAALPMLVMTTRAGEKHQRLAFQLGATDYFTKPVNEPLLLRRLESLFAPQGLAAQALASRDATLEDWA
ncbi:response regulator [Deinococcus gobiensis]|uniref:histidine kinase n=1 Tax=Deinococcus gobiensis (strain DSM 21396 / JCM 16679 / CGMCC 1.7299 / I-0) TaxID=745776 RepID=H8H0N5_DEIGI|nr:response regulator [Deinococcus gobiensis]AFD26904.1 CheA-related protein [Deinococcus gobiensis I-0]